MRIHRGRAFVRAWPAEHGAATGKAALVGIMEVEGPVDDEVVHGLVVLHAGGGCMLTTTGVRLEPEYTQRDQEVDGMLHSLDWPRPNPESGMDGGGIYLRRTEVPASTGCHTIVFVMLLSSDALPDQTMVDLSGSLPGTIRMGPPICMRHLETNGTTLSQILQRPLWGWEKETWGLTSALHVETLASCRRLEELLHGATPTDAGEMARLERGDAGSVLGSGRRDSEYQRFRQIWRERHGPEGWEPSRTAAQIAERETRIEAIIREMYGRMAA